jgi:3-hydroxyisobutyrate dehydrogenase
MIGFVGLGQMGSRMAARLVDAGLQVVAFDIDSAALQKLVTRGASAAASPAAVAAQAPIIFCSLPQPHIVEQIMIGDGGLSGGTAVEIIVDLSTTGPTKVIQIAAHLRPHGIELVDAPVSGGIGGAEAGKLSIMVSGSPAALARVQPLLRHMGDRIFVLGEAPGLGQKMKLVNNMLVAANAVAAFEALVMGVKSGLDATLMLDVINASSGRSFITTDKIPQCVLRRTFPQRFATNLLYKDLKLGVEEASLIGAPLWMMEAAQRFMAQAMEETDPTADYASLIKYFERRAGVEVAEQ